MCKEASLFIDGSYYSVNDQFNGETLLNNDGLLSCPLGYYDIDHTCLHCEDKYPLSKECSETHILKCIDEYLLINQTCQGCDQPGLCEPGPYFLGYNATLRCPFGYYNDDGVCKVEELDYSDPMTQTLQEML